MPVRTSSRSKAKYVPQLNIRAPVLMGFAVIAVFFGAGISGAAVAPIDKGVGLPGKIIVESNIKPVQHERGGRISEVFVAEGDEVKAGQLLATFDTTSLAEQIAALNAQAEASGRQLDLARQEAETFAELLGRKLTQRSRVLAIKRQVAQIEKEVASLNARIVVARQELDRARVLAPASGRVLTMRVNGIGEVVEAGGTLLEIVPASDKLVIEGRLPPDSIENVANGMPAKVWLSALSWRDQRPLPATLSWVSPDSVEDRRTGGRYYTARVVLDEAATEGLAGKVKLLPGMRTEILLLTGQRTLLDQIIDPLLRNMNRAFRD